MNRLPWRILGGVATGVALLALRGLSLWPIGERVDDAGLRLSWSARAERVESCRRLSDEELEQLAEHMRQRMACEGIFARYLLTLSIDGRVMASDTVRGGGLRHDRPIRLLRDYRVSPGERRVVVSLQRIDSTATAGLDASQVPTGALGDRGQREREERQRRAAEAMPARLLLDTTVTLTRGRVTMVTYLNEERRLVVGAKG